ncbi:MAG: hypothetical protein JXA42_02955 [Anaerolineales bacterium]|nr:hypothetical protein [Anaerolineales bacterium]
MLYLAHYLNHIVKKEGQPPSSTNGRIKLGNSPAPDQSDTKDLFSQLETEIISGSEQVMITNADGEILFSNAAIETEDADRLNNEWIIEEFQPGKLPKSSSTTWNPNDEANIKIALDIATTIKN